MTRRSVITIAFAIAALVLLVASPKFGHWFRLRQFNHACAVVASRGGSLRFDNVDGNYTLDLNGAASTDDTIASILPTLRDLPTGFTLVGPGEDRTFWINLSDSSITDTGLSDILALRVTFLTLDCPKLTDASADTLSNLNGSYVNLSPRTRFSDDAMSRLHDMLGYWIVSPPKPENGG